MRALRHSGTAIWLILSLATLLSWLLGHGPGDHAAASVAVLVIAMAKIRLVLLHFMELRHAPLAWRLVFEAWMAVVLVAMVVLYLAPFA